MSTSRIRVASVPANHVYVRHLAPVEQQPGKPEVVRLDDPRPSNLAPGESSRWWPPAMLEPGWVDAHHGEFDVFHIHFGFDARSPEDLQALVDALRKHRKPLVYTAHDLRNPHHDSRTLHDAQLAVLMRAAEEVITLTDGAAAEISRRWGRTARIIPHPHIVPLERMQDFASRPPRSDGRYRVGVHAKSLRASMNPLPVVRALVDLANQDQDILIQVNGHRDVLEPGGARFDANLAAFLDEASSNGALDLRIHDFLDDESFWDYLWQLDASVLPYRFGTHSGWLEACRDVGTAVIAPTCGYYADQGPVFSYENNETVFDAESFQSAVLAAKAAGPAQPVGEHLRRDARERIAAEHAEIYTRVLASPRTRGGVA